MRRYCHIGTGNYNPKTARLYEDLGLLTCDPEIGADLTQLFNFLTGYARDVELQEAAGRAARPAAPAHRAHRATRRGRRRRRPHHDEDEQPGRRRDDRRALRARRRPGVQIDLIVRGICCLRPGVPGLSDNIRVRSIVGRYLEHSRIYRFAHGAARRRPVLLHRLGRPDAPQPRPPGRGAGAGRPTPTCRTSSTRSSTSTSPTTCWPGRSGPTAPGTSADGRGEVDTHRRLQELALARRRSR